MKGAVAVVVLACGCSGGASDPYLISAAPTLGGGIVLNLEPAAGRVDGYWMEWRVDQSGDSFTSAKSCLAWQECAVIDGPTLPPDATDFEVRVRAEPGSRTSNILAVHRGTQQPLPPSVAALAAGRGFLVTYVNPSQTAPQIALQRRTGQLHGQAGPWKQIDVQAGATNTFEDDDVSEWIDGAHYDYRAILLEPGATASDYQSTRASALLSPEIVAASTTAAGTTLTTRNLSGYADRLWIHREAPGWFPPDQAIAAPPRGQTATFVERVAPAIVTYSVTAGTYGNSSPATTALEVILDPSSPLSGSIVQVPIGSGAAADGSGRFCIEAPAYPGTSILPPGGDASSRLVVGSATLKCLLDANGRPHTMYYEAPTSGSVGTIVHAWHDGTQWLTEPIATRSQVTSLPHSSQIAFDIGLDGTLFAAWYGAQGLELATKAAGGIWTVEVVGPSYLEGVAVSGDETGTPHLVIPSAGMHYFRDASGWHSETMPAIDTYEFAPYVFAGDGRIVAVVDRQQWGPPVVVEKDANGWSPIGVSTGTPMATVAARSQDGSAVAIAMTDGTLSIVRAGVLAKMTFPSTNTIVATGFDLAGKAWVLEWTSFSYGTGPVSAALFVER